MADPIVGEVLVDDLAHLRVVVVQHVGHEEEEHEDGGGLRRERDAAVLGVRVRREHVVHVVRAQTPEQHLREVRAQRHAREVRFRVRERAPARRPGAQLKRRVDRAAGRRGRSVMRRGARHRTLVAGAAQ